MIVAPDTVSVAKVNFGYDLYIGLPAEANLIADRQRPTPHGRPWLAVQSRVNSMTDQ